MDPIRLGVALAALALPLSQLALPEARRDGPTPWVAAGAWCAVVGALLLPGVAGTVAAGLDLVLCLWLGQRALRRGLSRTRVEAAELGLALAWAWAVGGAVWLLVGASGGTLLGFGGTWAWLTAAHFHAAGFAAVTLTSLVVRSTGRGVALLAAHPVAFALVAAGITGSAFLEKAGTVAYLTLFAAQLAVALRGGLHRRRGGLLALATLALPLATLALAADWALGGRHLDLVQMAWVHGLANAGGHAVLGMLAFALCEMPPRDPTS